MSRILILAPSFFGYRDSIAKEMMRQGHEVTCLNDRPSESVAFRSIAKVGYGPLEAAIARFADEVGKELNNGGYDYLIYLSGMSFCFTRDQFERIRALSNAKFVAGLWDALGNCRRLPDSLSLFDEVFSFEPADCNRYGLSLRPLFFVRGLSTLPLTPKGGFKYDACFVGSIHQPSKFMAVNNIVEQLRSCGLRVFTHYYMPSRSALLLREVQSGCYRKAKISFNSMNAREIAQIYAMSKAVIDSPQAGQCGLTMRSIEALGARRKLITVNAKVADYDFYESGNVAIWEDAERLESGFFERPYINLPIDVYESYSIDSYVKTLLGEAPSYSGYRKA